jgi:hypothetical protein
MGLYTVYIETFQTVSLGDLVDRGNGGALTISAGSIYDGLVVVIVLGRFA